METITQAGSAASLTSAKVPAQAGIRDTRIDVIRAIALIMIFINHVPGQIFEYATTKNFGFSDAAESFVLISGMSVALAYGRRFNGGDSLDATRKLITRAWTLYKTHLVLTAITVAVFAAGAYAYSHPMLLREINIGPLVEEPTRGLVAVLLLGHQLGYNNILPLYAALLLMTPVFFWVEARSPLALLTGSFALWLAAGLFRIAPPNMLDDNVWFLNPLSWQFLFAIGIVCVMHVKRGGKISRHPVLIALASAYALTAGAWVLVPLWSIDISSGLPPVLTGFDKTFLSLPRLLHVLSLAYLVVAIAPISNLLRQPLDNPLTVLGRHGLAIFAAGTVLAMIGQVLLKIYDDAPLFGPAYVVAGTLALFAYAYYLEAEKTEQKARATKQALAPAHGVARAHKT